MRSVGSAMFVVALCSVSLGPMPARAESGPWPAATGLMAAADSATTAEGNPAGMALLDRTEAVAQLVVLGTRSEETIAASGVDASSDDDSEGVYAIPAFYYVRPLSDRIAAGISLVVPAGFGGEYDDDAPSRYLVTEWSMAYVAVAPALSYRINDQLSVGIGVALNYSKLSFENAVFNGLLEDDGSMEVEADGFAVSWKLGLLWQPGPDTRLGLSYRSKVDTDLSGEADFSDLTDATRQRLAAAGLLDRDVELGGRLPPVMALGLYQRLPNGWHLSVDAAYVEWSKFQLVESTFFEGQLVQRGQNYQDAWAGSLGLSLPLNARWRLGLGIGYLENPIDAEDRGFGFRVSESWIAGAGIEYQLGDDCSVGVNLNYLDMGDGEIQSAELGAIGVIESKYEENHGLVVEVSYRW